MMMSITAFGGFPGSTAASRSSALSWGRRSRFSLHSVKPRGQRARLAGRSVLGNPTIKPTQRHNKSSGWDTVARTDKRPGLCQNGLNWSPPPPGRSAHSVASSAAKILLLWMKQNKLNPYLAFKKLMSGIKEETGRLARGKLRNSCSKITFFPFPLLLYWSTAERVSKDSLGDRFKRDSTGFKYESTTELWGHLGLSGRHYVWESRLACLCWRTTLLITPAGDIFKTL